MAEQFLADELDDATYTYLRAVGKSRGAGMPGVYAAASNWMPFLGVLCGVLVLAGVLLLTWGSVEDPTRTALLQTAGLILGGWLFISGVRGMAAESGPHDFGHFVFIDPRFVWQVKGGSVTAESLDGLHAVNVTHHHTDNNYTHTAFELGLGHGRRAQFNIHNQEQADLAAKFLEALGQTANATHGDGEPLPSGARGVLARELARTGGMPGSLDAKDVPFVKIPEPRKERRAAAGGPLFRSAVVMALAAAACVAVLRPLNATMRDDALFDLVKKENPPQLRYYLVDSRNTAHRDEAQKLLDGYYDRALETLAQRKVSASIRKGLAGLATAARAAPQPVVTVSVACADTATDKDKAEEPSVRQRVAEEMAELLGRNDLVGFAQARDGADGQLKVVYRRTKPSEREGRPGVEWKLTFRPTPGGEATEYTATVSANVVVKSPDGRSVTGGDLPDLLALAMGTADPVGTRKPDASSAPVPAAEAWKRQQQMQKLLDLKRMQQDLVRPGAPPVKGN
jgi:hypothetical protein